MMTEVDEVERSSSSEETGSGKLQSALKSVSDEEAALPAPSSGAPKPLYERHKLEFIVIILGGSALAFNAGFVNGCTYLARNMPVSHITGTTTHAGMSLGQGDFDSFLVYIAVVVCFIFGSAISGSMMNDDVFQLGKAYGPLFLIGSFLFMLSCIFATLVPESDLYFYFAAMACGLQNSLTTRYSGSIIRTTHMTGAGTDIGLTLGRMAVGEWKDAWKLQLLCPLYISFLFGGYVSVQAYNKMGRMALMINVLVFFCIGVAYSVVVGNQLHIPIWKSMIGAYTFMETNVREVRQAAKSASKKIARKLKKVRFMTTSTSSTARSPYEPLVEEP